MADTSIYYYFMKREREIHPKDIAANAALLDMVDEYATLAFNSNDYNYDGMMSRINNLRTSLISNIKSASESLPPFEAPVVVNPPEVPF